MLPITSANAITSAKISWGVTSAKAIRSAYMYGNNTNHTKILKILWKNILPHTSFGVQNCWDNIFFRPEEAMLDKLAKVCLPKLKSVLF